MSTDDKPLIQIIPDAKGIALMDLEDVPSDLSEPVKTKCMHGVISDNYSIEFVEEDSNE